MSECLRIVSLLIPVGGWERVNTIYTGCLNMGFACTFWEQKLFPSYQHQRQLGSYSGRKSDWQDCLLPGSHSGGVSCDRLKPTSPHRPWPPLGPAALVSFLRWQQPPVWQIAAVPTLKINVNLDCSWLETAIILPVPNCVSPAHEETQRFPLNRTCDTRQPLYPCSNFRHEQGKIPASKISTSVSLADKGIYHMSTCALKHTVESIDVQLAKF